MSGSLPLLSPTADTRLRAVTGPDLAEALAHASASPRLRTNLNVHRRLDDPIQRLFNVMQPGTYIRPHRHEPERWELFVILSGSAGVLTFDDAGVAREHIVLEPGSAWAVEIAGGTFHTAVALQSDTVLFEVKPGPYRALEDKDFAPAFPAEHSPDTTPLLATWKALLSL